MPSFERSPWVSLPGIGEDEDQAMTPVTEAGWSKSWGLVDKPAPTTMTTIR